MNNPLVIMDNEMMIRFMNEIIISFYQRIKQK